MTKTLLGIFLLCLSAPTFAAVVTCYNDDSLDVINQDEVPWPSWDGRISYPEPADCAQGPAVVISEEGALGHRVLIDGKTIYTDSFDPVLEARVAPAAVALRTQRGSLLLFRKNARRGRDELVRWFTAGVDKAREFKFARNGNLLGISEGGELIVDGRAVFSVNRAERLFAAASGRMVALMNDGRLLDERGTEISRDTIDGAQLVKLAADGTAVWVTRDGHVRTSKNRHLYDGFDRVLSFKVTPTGSVAYVDQEGRLGRDGTRLDTGFSRVTRYKIYRDGAVTATDDQGRAHYFP